MNLEQLGNYKPPADLLAERVIVVTGATRGIGRAAAKSFAAHGAVTILLGRTVPDLESLYDEIVEAGAPEPAIYPMDLRGAQPDDYTEMAQRLKEEFGRLDGILHNAASLGHLSPLEHYGIADWYEVIQVNLHAPFLMTRACLPLLKKASDASILFTSSKVGRKGKAYWGAYAVSQSAVEGMMQVLSDELDSHTTVRVNSIDPGPVRTRMRLAAYPAEDSSRLPAPEDIVHPYLFLLGPDSRGVTGRALNARQADEL